MARVTRSSLRKPSRVREGTTESSWRDHPVVVASIAAAATLTLMGGVVFPLLTTHLSSEIAELRKVADAKGEEIDGLKKQIEGLDRKLADQKAALQKVENEKTKITEQLRLSTIENPFVLPSGYPKGLDTIRVGFTPTDVEAAFHGTVIDKKQEDYWSIEIEHPIFSSVTYYFGFKDREITHILFHNRYQGPIKDEDMVPLVRRYFGKSRLSIEENHLWVTGGVGAERITVYDGGALAIYSKDVFPNWVARAYEKCERNDAVREGDLGAFCERIAKARKPANKDR